MNSVNKEQVKRFISLLGCEERVRREVRNYCHANKIKSADCPLEARRIQLRLRAPVNTILRLDELSDIEAFPSDFRLGLSLIMSNLDRYDYENPETHNKLSEIYHSVAKYEARVLSNEQQQFIIDATCEVLNKFLISATRS